jgi:hypothetical protein
MFMFILLLLTASNIILAQKCNTFTRQLTEIEKATIINAHNFYRNQMATQTNTVGPKFPFATNMLQFYWNDAIAAKAQDWANNCQNLHSSQEFRAQPDYFVGENIYFAWSSIDYPKLKFKDYVDMWFKEITLSSPDIINKYAFDSSTGHFTQIIWSTSNQLGCGVAQFTTGDGKFKNLFVCQYGPAGNILNYPIYAASEQQECDCPNDYTCSNSVYVGLCCKPTLCNSLYSTVDGQAGTNTPVTTTRKAASRIEGSTAINRDDQSSGSSFYSMSLLLLLVLISLF